MDYLYRLLTNQSAGEEILPDANIEPPRQRTMIDPAKLRPGVASLVVQAVASDTGRQEDGAGRQEAKASLSKEQLLKIQIELPDLRVLAEGRDSTQLILVVDKSGSMAGNSWNQVQASVKDIIGRCVGKANLRTDLITYADVAHLIQFDASNYETVINGIKAGGMTNFKAAFTKVNRVVTEAGTGYTRTVIMFMTDGEDTVNIRDVVAKMPLTLAKRFQELNKDVVIHTVGFTASHDFNFLKKLSESGGTSPGMFRYCEPGDDRQVLKRKLDELFDFIYSNKDYMEVRLTIFGDNNMILTPDSVSETATLQGKVEYPESEDQAAAKPEPVLMAETWIQLADPYDMPVINLQICTTITLNGENKVISIPCTIGKIDFKVLDSDADKATWRLRILSRNVDALVAKVGKAIAENGDVGSFQSRIEKYQKQISHTRVFGNGISKDGRLLMFETIKEIQVNLDEIQTLLAQHMRGDAQSISLLARAHDMRYQAVFRKSRQQRIMDKRVSKNLMQASSAQENLASLTVNKQEVENISQDAAEFYFCMLSQNSIQDVLLGDDKDDAIGFGLAVKRSEVVLDEPTLLRLQVISGTFVSRTAMLDALEYKINVSSHLGAHGGFSFQDAPLGVTTVGTSREPINAWLPLYINRAHWERVQVILRPALGMFCTLDPLGYDYKQIDVMFMTLGSMIGQLTEGSVGEHQLRLLFAVHRTCTACMVDFDLVDKVTEFVARFIASPAGRTKDVIPNLYTVIGYIVSLPTDVSRRLFCLNAEAEGHKSGLRGFWVGLIAECLRRAAGGLYRETNVTIINGLLDAVLHGTTGGVLAIVSAAQSAPDTEPAMCRAAAELQRLCLASDNEEIDVPAFDPAVGVKVPQVKLEHYPKVDRAMETWAERECGYIKSKTANKKYNTAKRVVQQWVAEGQGSTKAVSMPDCGPSTSAGCTSIHVAVEEEVIDETSIEEGAQEEVETKDEETSRKPEVVTDETSIEEGAQEEVETKDEETSRKPEVVTDPPLKQNKTDETSTEEGAQEEVEINDEETSRKPDFDCQMVTQSMIRVLAQLHNQLCRATYPNVQSLPGCIAFVNTWLSQERSFDDIDNNSGLAPQVWVDEIKGAISTIYTEMNEYSTNIQAEDEKNTTSVATATEMPGCSTTTTTTTEDDREVLVVIDTDNAIEQNASCVENSTTAVDTKGEVLVKDNDVEDLDSDDDGEYYSDTADSDEEMAAIARNTALKTAKVKPVTKITLPMVLHHLHGDMDVTLTLRAMVCQAVQYHSNSSARAAITAERLLDLGGDPSVAETTVCMQHEYLEEHRDTIRKTMIERALNQRANHCMVHASTPMAFVGYLMSTYSNRGEGFNDLLDLFLATLESRSTLPYVKEKIHMLLTGKYKDCIVFASGNQFLPEKKMAVKITTIVGEEVWLEFQVELRSSVQIHVYRESDIPNRHGHCNSNPYIPNLLRVKLGMALLPEKRGGPKTWRSYLKTNKTS